MDKEIGGYFELSLGTKQKNIFSSDAVYVNSGRNAFEYILKSIPKIGILWLPYYTCSSLYEPLERLNIKVKYYHITKQLEIETLEDIILKPNDYLLYTNYFGVKQAYALSLYAQFGNQLILDNSQALFAIQTPISFFSPRKFLGIPDGGIAFSSFKYEVEVQDVKTHIRFMHLLKRFDFPASHGYNDFKVASETISNQPLSYMSNLTRKLIETIDFESIRKKREDNFLILHQELASSNELLLDSNTSGALVYPYLNKNMKGLKEVLIAHKIYVATYWPNTLSELDSSTTEHIMANSLVNIPLDQRYSKDDMKYIISIIQKFEQ